jgi:hypothetical protein
MAPLATPPGGRLVGLGEPRMGWAEPPGHPGPGQLALTGRGGRGGAVCSHIFKCHNTVYQYLVLVERPRLEYMCKYWGLVMPGLGTPRLK